MPPKITKKYLKTKTKPKKSTPGLRAQAVLAYLQQHPGFLQTHAQALLQAAAPAKAPAKVANLFSLQAARATAAEGKLKALKKRFNQLVAIARANAHAQAQAHEAVLALLHAPHAAALSKALQGPFKQALGLHGARLLRVGAAANATTLTAAELAALCPTPLVLEPYQAARHAPLFGPQGGTLKSCALLRLTSPPEAAPLGLLALGSEDDQHFHAGQATDLLEFLRRVVSLRVEALAP